MKKHLPAKPLVEMTAAEQAEVWRAIGAGGTHGMLQDARNGIGLDTYLAIALLDPGARPAFVVNEYGDRDGIEAVERFIDDVNHLPGILAEGESVRMIVVKMTAFVEVTEKEVPRASKM